MGKGRKKKPVHLHILNGNPGKRRLNRHAPNPPRGIPEPPAHLSERAKTAWPVLAKELDRMGVLTLADVFALEQLAENYAEVLDHREALVKNKSRYQTIRTTNGTRKKVFHPAQLALSDSEKRFRAMLEQFGLTPSSRSRVDAKPQAVKDPFEKFLDGTA